MSDILQDIKTGNLPVTELPRFAIWTFIDRLIDAYTGAMSAGELRERVADVYRPGMGLELVAIEAGLLPEAECRCNGFNNPTGCAGCYPQAMIEILADAHEAKRQGNDEVTIIF